MLICMTLLRENDDEAVYAFGDGSGKQDGVVRIDKHDIDKSGLFSMPTESELTWSDVQKAIVKAVKSSKDNKYPKEVTRAS